jgi:hypothetical protein
MCHIVPICHFFGGLKGFLIHFELIILICVELKFTRGRLENHTIFTKIITYKSISKNT